MFRGYFAFDHSFKEVFFPVENQSNGGAEAGGASIGVFQFIEEFERVGFRVVTVGEGIAGGVNAGASAECIDLKSGVVGKAIDPVVLADPARQRAFKSAFPSNVSAVSGMSS